MDFLGDNIGDDELGEAFRNKDPKKTWMDISEQSLENVWKWDPQSRTLTVFEVKRSDNIHFGDYIRKKALENPNARISNIIDGRKIPPQAVGELSRREIANLNGEIMYAVCEEDFELVIMRASIHLSQNLSFNDLHLINAQMQRERRHIEIGSVLILSENNWREAIDLLVEETSHPEF